MWRSVIPKLGVVVVETCLKLQACLPVFVGGNCCSLINFLLSNGQISTRYWVFVQKTEGKEIDL